MTDFANRIWWAEPPLSTRLGRFHLANDIAAKWALCGRNVTTLPIPFNPNADDRDLCPTCTDAARTRSNV